MLSPTRRLALSFAVLLMVFAPTLCFATENASVAAQLSWNATNASSTNLTSPGSPSKLYVLLKHGVTSYRGAEIDISWEPDGDIESGCLAHALTEYKTSSGTSCTYLNRGTTVPITITDEPGRFHVSWSNSTSLTSCTSGAIIAIGFDFDGCESDTAQFVLCSLRLLDGNYGVEDVPAESLGTPATVFGGGNYVSLCSDDLRPDTTGCDSCHALIGGPSATTYNVVTGTVLGVTPWIDDEAYWCDDLANPCIMRWHGAGLPTTATLDSVTGLLTWIAGPVGDDYPNASISLYAGRHLKDTYHFGIQVLPTDSIHFGLLHAKNDIIFGSGSKIDSTRAEWTNFTIRPMTDPFPSQELDALVVGAQERGLDVVINLTTDADSDDIAYWPPEGGDSTGYLQRVKDLAKRYSIDSSPSLQAPGLLRSVDWWHVEEESGFLRSDECGCDYMRELVATRKAVLAGNPYAKILLVGFQSDWSWLDAYVTGKATTVEPVSEDDNLSSALDSVSAGFTAFKRRVRNWLVANNTTECNLVQAPLAYWYDAIDVHSFERRDVIRGKVHWIQNLENYHGHMPIWVNEAGGPAYQHRLVGNEILYSDTLNAESVYKNYAEALANGIKRYAWQTFPGHDVSFLYRNIALFRDPTPGLDAVFAADFVPKASFQAYRALTGLVKDFNAAYDYRLTDSIPYILRPIYDEDSVFVGTYREYPSLDLRDQEACTMNLQFETGGSLVQSNVVWRGAHSIVDSVYVQTQTLDSTAVFYVTKHSLQPDAAPEVVTVAAVVESTTFHRIHADSLGLPIGDTFAPDTTILVSRCHVGVSGAPIIISCSQPFSVYQVHFDTAGTESLTSVPPPARGRQHSVSVVQRPSGELLLDWSLTQPGSESSVDILDVLGRVVRTVRLDTRHESEGRTTWDISRPSRGRPAAGIYFAVLRSNNEIAATTRFIILK